MIDMLEKESFIVRVPDQIDRRINRIFLTTKAKELRCKAIAEVFTLYDSAMSGLTEDEKTLFLKSLTTIAHNLGSSSSCGYG